VINVTPGDMPVTTPVEELIVPAAGLPLVQMPPEVVLVIVVVDPIHTFGTPPIGAGSGLTVTVAKDIVNVGNV
jgi:hypothetical protein